MKKLIVIPLLFISLVISATNYYVKTGGNDSNTGLSDTQAWLTISKVNTVWAAGTFAHGDSILFNRGDTFTGTLTVSESGTSGSPIIVGAYGTGADPIITGWSTLSSWTDEGGSIYSKTVSLASSEYMIVSVDGSNVRMGRYPNHGASWLTIDSYSTNVSITDAATDAAVTDWDGAEVVIRKNDYILNRLDITNHTGTTISFAASGYNSAVGYPFFIQNDLRTLDATNEWYYNGTKFYIYSNPAAKTVKVSNAVNAVIINSFDYITFDNINFQGYGGDGFSLTDASHITIQNCSISFCGESGIRSYDETSGNSGNCVINNNTITDCNNNGILGRLQFGDVTISNNTIQRIGLIAGAAHNMVSAYESLYFGINIVKSPDVSLSTIEYNSLDSIGYMGISMNQCINVNKIVRYNFVNHFCMILSDGGGIYTYAELTDTDENNSIQFLYNIVLNAVGEGEAAAVKYANGIYVDGYSRGVTCSYNTAAYAAGGGGTGANFFFNGNRDGVMKYNTGYNSNSSDNLGFSRFSNTVDVHENLEMKYNKFISVDSDERCGIYYSSYGVPSATADIDSNYYIRPKQGLDAYLFYTNYPSAHFYTFSQWQTFSGQDANSSTTSVTVADTSEIDFYYNATKTPDTIVLSYPMIDVTGTRYPDTLILQAYTSAVLMLDPNPPSTDFWYIDPAGDDDTGDGSSGNPWKTLAYAASQVTTIGDTIHINAGTYTETEQVVVAPGVNLYGVGETNPVINSTRKSDALIVLSSVAEGSYGNQYISNLTFSGGDSAFRAIDVERRNNVHIHDCTVEDFVRDGVLFKGRLDGNDDEPVTYATGNKFYNNTVTNCSGVVSGTDGRGNLNISGQSGMLIYDNVLTTEYRGVNEQGYVIKAQTNGGFFKGVKIYGNTLTRPAFDGELFDFGIEFWDIRGGVEVYDNEFINCSIDIGGYYVTKGDYDYSIWVHDNTLYQQSRTQYEGTRGIVIEGSVMNSDIIIEKNLIYNTATGISYGGWEGTPNTVQNLRISYNVIDSIGVSEAGAASKGWGIYSSSDSAATVTNVNIYNNIFDANIGATRRGFIGILLPSCKNATYVRVKNNIIKDFSYAATRGYHSHDDGENLDYYWIQNNIFYNNGSTISWEAGYVHTNGTETGNLTDEPLFISGTFRPKSNSPAVNAGLDVGLTTDYRGYGIKGLPDIGAYEFLPIRLKSAGKYIKDSSKYIIQY